MDFSKLLSMLPVFQRLDPETLALFLQFGKKALASGDPNAYVKRSMLTILQPEVVVAQAKLVK